MEPLNPGIETEPMMAVAGRYRALGLSFIPIAADGSKRPDWRALPSVIDDNGVQRRPWKGYQERHPTTDEFTNWFLPWIVCGIAVIAGRISGNLEVIDADNKDVAREFEERLRCIRPDLLVRLVIVESPRGRHYYYRCDVIGRNGKLAQAPDPCDPSRPKTLIDLKAEGGYVIAPPSPGQCHPTGIPYAFFGGRDFSVISTVAPEERAVLLECARSCNKWVTQQRIHQSRPKSITNGLTRPGDDFNARSNWFDILTPHKWKFIREVAGVGYWRRPGKDDLSHSATTNYADNDLLHVFSTSAAPFEPNRSYNKFCAYALLNHNGDFKSAALTLVNGGYDCRSWAWRSLATTRASAGLGFVPRSVRRTGEC